MKPTGVLLALLAAAFIVGVSFAALTAPTDIMQPGTQAEEISGIETPTKCDNCHGGYDSAVEPSYNWSGSMMANATRDPVFWAAMAVAEQDFNGAGDLCLRCHAPSGWYGGSVEPTDGSDLAEKEASGVDCDICHMMTNPDNSGLLGEMNDPFVANDGGTPAAGYYGSGMLSLRGGTTKIGPYEETAARHKYLQSDFYRSRDYCGSCHDVSNPMVGDLAPNNGAQDGADPVTASGVLGGPVEDKAAFNNFPYQYGVMERTYSEYYAGALPWTLVSDYASLPADLQAGAIQAAYTAAPGDYVDGTERYFTCQTCHMPAVTGAGCDKSGAEIRTDLPLHDLTGGNYWVPEAIAYQDAAETLRLGGGLSATQLDAMIDGALRARQQLELAATLEVSGNTVRITNLTGHKLISGYPEGRRMWLNIKWYDDEDSLLREDGEYGSLIVTLNSSSEVVETLLDLDGTNTKIYQATYGISQEWAAELIGMGYDPALPLSFDRISGDVAFTLGQLAALPAGSSAPSFHFVLNNEVIADNRIPPYGFDYEQARQRNALPVPAEQYGGSPGGSYNYWDEVTLNPPSGAAYAEISLMYQPTSWEYVQFLYLANESDSEFLAGEGANLLDAWLSTGMAEPHPMAAAIWECPVCSASTPTLTSAVPGDRQVELTWSDLHTADPNVVGYKVYYENAGNPVLAAQVDQVSGYTDTGLTNGSEYCYVVTSLVDSSGDGDPDCESDYSNIVCATPEEPLPDAPENVAASDGSFYDHVAVSWDAVTVASEYQVWRDTDPGGTGMTQIGTTALTSFDDSAVVELQVYHYWITACSSAGCSAASTPDDGFADQEPLNILFWDDVETGDLSRWTRVNTGDGWLYACSEAAINDAFGICVNSGDNTKRKQLIDDSPIAQTTFNVRFYFDINSLFMSQGDRFRFMQLKMNPERPAFLVMMYDGGNYYIQLNTKLDDLTKIKSSWYLLTDEPHTIEVDWQASSAPGADDGYAELYIDDVLKEAINNLDNDTLYITSFRMGFTSRLWGKDISGVFYIDDVVTSDNRHIGVSPLLVLLSE